MLGNKELRSENFSRRVDTQDEPQALAKILESANQQLRSAHNLSYLDDGVILFLWARYLPEPYQEDFYKAVLKWFARKKLSEITMDYPKISYYTEYQNTGFKNEFLPYKSYNLSYNYKPTFILDNFKSQDTAIAVFHKSFEKYFDPKEYKIQLKDVDSILLQNKPEALINAYKLKSHDEIIIPESDPLDTLPVLRLPAGPREKTADTLLLERVIKAFLSGLYPLVEIDRILGEVTVGLPEALDNPVNLTALFHAANLDQVDFSTEEIDRYETLIKQFYPDIFKAIKLHLAGKFSLPEYFLQLPKGLLMALMIYTGPYRINELANGKFSGDELNKIFRFIPMMITTLGMASFALRELPGICSRLGANVPYYFRPLFRVDDLKWLSYQEGPFLYENTSFTSTSSEKLSMLACPVFERPSYMPSLAPISFFPHEDEVLLNAGSQFIMSGHKFLGPFAFFQARLVNTPSRRPISYLVGIALRYAYKMHLALKYTDAPGLVISKGNGFLYRPYHGLPHTMAKVFYVDAIVDYLARYASDPELKQFCQDLDYAMRDFIKLILVFSVTGRESEISFAEDPVKYREYKRHSGINFSVFALEKKLHDRCDRGARLVQHLCDPNFATTVNVPGADGYRKEDNFIHFITSMAHDLDAPRVDPKTKFDVTMQKYHDGVEQTEAQQADWKLLYDYVIECIKTRGDVLLDGHAKDGQPQFFQPIMLRIADNPLLCEKTLEQVPTPQFRRAIIAHNKFAYECQQVQDAREKEEKTLIEIEEILGQSLML